MECKQLIMIHGGAGTWSKAPKERIEGAKKALKQAAEVGMDVLIRERNSLEAVASAIEVMEDSGYLNAGIGSGRNAEGYIEMDAGIMDGSRLDAGAVASLRGIKNPIRVAKLVMEKTPHILLVGDGALKFALASGFSISPELTEKKIEPYEQFERDRWKGDTVGAVAVDKYCRTAAGASTGGVRGKMPGRVGDSPIPGAGYYANHFAAASATGIGEVIILVSATRWIVEEATTLGTVKLAGRSLINYVNNVYNTNTIGIIAIDIKGNYKALYNTESMPYAVAKEGNNKILFGGLKSV